MKTWTRYCSRLFLASFFVILSGFVALVGSFDLMKNGDQVVQRHAGEGLALAHYAVLRVPEIVSIVLPLCVLVAALLTLARLALNNEVLAFRSSGVPSYKLMLAFLPAAALVSGFHFLVNDQLSPRARHALARWGAQGKLPQAPVEGGFWTRDGTAIIHFQEVFNAGAELRQVTVFRLDQNSNLVQRITARSAKYLGGRWLLQGVRRLSVPTGSQDQLAQLDWSTDLRPSHLADLATPPSSLSLTELLRFAAHPAIGNHPNYLYKIWLYRRIALLVLSPLMVLLAAPVAAGLDRLGGVALRFGIGVGIGFLYFVLDGAVLKIGESGAIPAVLGALCPMVVFAVLGAAMLARMDAG